MKIAVGHLFPDYLNIYADRGNIAVLTRRADWRGHDLEVEPIGAGDSVRPGAHDLYYIGGGQDREQELIAPALAALGEALREGVSSGAALLAVCGGYQLLGRSYRDQSGDELEGVGLFPLQTAAGERRMIGDVLLECALEPGERRTLAGFENHAGRTFLDDGAEPLGRVLAGFGNDGSWRRRWPTEPARRCPSSRSGTNSKLRHTRSPPPGPERAAGATNNLRKSGLSRGP